MYEFRLPIYIGKEALNMNQYRNNHYQKNSKHKREFYPLKADLWEGKAKQILISYSICKRTNRRYDTMNIVSVVDKYFLDWLVTNGHLSDDNCDNVSYGAIHGIKGAKNDYAFATINVLEMDI